MHDAHDCDERVAELERRLEEEVGRLRRLLELATQLNSTPNLDDLLELIISSAKELVGAELGSLLLLDEESDELYFRVAEEIAGVRMPATAGIAGWVVQHREPVTVDDVAADPRFYGQIDALSGTSTRNLLAVPLLAKDACLGVVQVLNKADGFTEQDVATAQALAGLAAAALENAAIYERLTEAVVTARLSTSATE